MVNRNRKYPYTLDHVRKVMYQKRGRDHCPKCGKELIEGDEVTRTRAKSGNWLWHSACHEARYIDLPDLEAEM